MIKLFISEKSFNIHAHLLKKMYTLNTLLLTICLGFSLNDFVQRTVTLQFISTEFNEKPEYPESVASLVEYFDEKGMDIRELLNDPRFELYEGISNRFKNAAEIKTGSFEEYKVKFGYEEKIASLPEFMETYSEALQNAENDYGIPQSVISAIIGIESSFGKYTGKYNPFNAYVSMYSEEYRVKFALAQLEELLIFAEKNQLDIHAMKSSYAGAMTYAQFIPYSLNRWFVGDDLQDMNNNIYSVANYLAHFKEITGSIERAVFRYNPSEMYTLAVMTIAEEAEKINNRSGNSSSSK